MPHATGSSDKGEIFWGKFSLTKPLILTRNALIVEPEWWASPDPLDGHK